LHRFTTSENIAKGFRGLLFLTHTVCSGYHRYTLPDISVSGTVSLSSRISRTCEGDTWLATVGMTWALIPYAGIAPGRVARARA